MQRLHEADLAGDLIEKGGYELLRLPEEFEPETCCETVIGWVDPRTEYHQLLWPEHRTRIHVERLKVTLGSYRYAGQYQQNPRPAGGNLFKNWWWRYWQPAGANLPAVTVRNAEGEELKIYPVDLPDSFDEVLQSWDMTFKDTKSSDMVAGGCWASKGAGRFLLDQRCERMNFPKTIEAVRAMTSKWPESHRKLVEDKANGSAVIATLQHEIPGLIPVNPEGGKIARAHAVSAVVEAGNVFLPHPMIAPWVDGYLAELSIFPNGRHDDQVDQTTQSLNRLSAGLAYGLTVYMSELQDKIDAARVRTTAERLQSQRFGVVPKQAAPAEQPTAGCPECGATCIALVSSGGWRCSQCGEQFSETQREKFRPNRSEAGYFSGKSA
jgi:predicted phage terminase large subunit-like protein